MSRHLATPLALSLIVVSPALATQDPQPPPAEPPPPPPATATENTAAAADAAARDARLDEIDQRARIIERKLELADEAAAARAAGAAAVVASDRGFSITSTDKAYQVRVRGLVNADSRFYLDDDQLSLQDRFLIRRARPLIDASFGNVADFRIMPDFGGGSAVLQDAYGDFRPFPWLKLRLGKFKSPVGLERLQSASAIVFVERALPTALAPNRDVGAMLWGDVGAGVFQYYLAVLNGVTDGASGDVDTNHAKDLAARLFFQPWKGDPYSFLNGLGFGVSGTIGNQRGTPGAATNGLPRYSSAGQQAFFSYNPDVIARKRRARLSPQLYFYWDRFGLLSEYILSEHTVELRGAQKKLVNFAWQVALSCMITGDKNSHEGPIVKANFDPTKGTWGALELAARYNELAVDDETFTADATTTYANSTTAARRARGFAVGLIWTWSKNLAWEVNFEQTRFEGGGGGTAAAPLDRKTENVIFTRGQVSF